MQSSQRQEHQEKLDGIFQDDNIMKFLVEKSKTATSGIGLYPLIEEFVQLHGHYHDPETICRRFRDKTVRKIHLLGMSDEDIARVLFVTSISVNKTVLEELKKNALVELDAGRRIIKFASFDGLVKFEGTHQRQVPINTINSPAPADPKKRKVGEVEEEQKEPPMKKTRGDEKEEIVVKKEEEEEEVEASEVPKNLEELPEVQEEVSQRVEDHVEEVAAPDAPGVEEEPKNAPEEAKEVKVAAEENGGAPEAPKAPGVAPDAPEAQEMKEEPKKAPELKEAAPKAQEVAQDTSKAPVAPKVASKAPEVPKAAPKAPEAPKAAPGVPKMKKTAPEAPKAAPKASGAPGPPARKMAAPRLPKETPRMRGFSPAAPKENVAPKDLSKENPLEKEVKNEIEDDEEYNKAAPKKEFVDYVNKLKSAKNRANKNAEHSERNDGEGTSSEIRRSSHSERNNGEGISSEIRKSSRNDSEGTSSEIRRSSRKSLPTWRKAEGSESSEPRGKKVAAAAPAAPKAAESSESNRVTRSRNSTDAPTKMEDTPKSVAKTTPVAVKTVKKPQVSSPIIVPKGMEGAPESKKRGPKTPASSKTPKKAREPPQNVRRSARTSGQAAKIASAPPTPAPAKPVVTRHVAFNGSGPLPQGPSAPGAHASGSTVTNKHFLEHTRQFVASIDTPECNKMTKRYDNLIKKMKDESIDLEKLQKALQSTITILTSKKK